MTSALKCKNYREYLDVESQYIDYLQSSASGSYGEKIANLLVDEFFKFFVLSTNFPDQMIQISKAVDDIWHFAILETKHYRKLNSTNNKGRFLDHSKIAQEETLIDEFNETKNDFEFCLNYIHFFGEFSEEALQYWPQANRLANKSNISFDQLNELLIQLSEKMSSTG